MTPIQPPVFIRLTESEGKRPCIIRPADIRSATQGDDATCINFRVESFVAEKYTLKQIPRFLVPPGPEGDEIRSRLAERVTDWSKDDAI